MADTPVSDALVVYKQRWTNDSNPTLMLYCGVRGIRCRLAPASGTVTNGNGIPVPGAFVLGLLGVGLLGAVRQMKSTKARA